MQLWVVSVLKFQHLRSRSKMRVRFMHGINCTRRLILVWTNAAHVFWVQTPRKSYQISAVILCKSMNDVMHDWKACFLPLSHHIMPSSSTLPRISYDTKINLTNCIPYGQRVCLVTVWVMRLLDFSLTLQVQTARGRRVCEAVQESSVGLYSHTRVAINAVCTSVSVYCDCECQIKSHSVDPCLTLDLT